MRTVLLTLCVVLAGLAWAAPSSAQSPEQRRELLDIKKDLAKGGGLIRKKEFEEAKALYDDADARLTKIATDLSLSKSDKKLLGIEELIEKGRESLEIALAKAEGRPPKIGVSFADSIAPIIEQKCLNCHGGANPRAGLDLSTFAGWRKGGRSGPLITPGSAARSLLFAKLTTPDMQRRMPQNGPPLSDDELRLIGKWIEGGARYDGDKEDTLIADLGSPGAGTLDASVIIPKPTGSETVSFKRDIAPFMSNLCVRCHNSNRKSGGLSLETFYDMMKGGDSGRVVLPGNVEGSRLFRLTGGLENPRMPADNQSRITRQNYEDLKKWFEEGNAFDGDDPRTPLRTLAMAATEAAGDRFAKLSASEFNLHRKTRTEELWKKAVSNEPSAFYETTDFLVFGNVSTERLRQIDGWAQDHLKNLRQTFGGSGQAWKGRLAIIVFKDRFGYEEFNQINNGRRAPKEMTGHSVVSPTYEDAYVCLQDVGDDATKDFGGLQVSLLEHMTAAFLQREGARVPDWVVRGTGLAMAHAVLPGNAYLKDLDLVAAESVRVVLNPVDLFTDGTFSPATTGAVGYSLVKYMFNNGGAAKFGSFIKALREGQSPAQAVRAVYSADLEAVARGYLGSLGRRTR